MSKLKMSGTMHNADQKEFVLPFISIIIPLGAVDPFHTREFITAQYVHTPSVPQILAWLIPLEMSLLCFVWLFEQPKSSVEDYND